MGKKVLAVINQCVQLLSNPLVNLKTCNEFCRYVGLKTSQKETPFQRKLCPLLIFHLLPSLSEVSSLWKDCEGFWKIEVCTKNHPSFNGQKNIFQVLEYNTMATQRSSPKTP